MWGDVVPVPAIQFARPDRNVAFDTGRPAAVASRARVLHMVTAARCLRGDGQPMAR
jgi:hypothetical protein